MLIFEFFALKAEIIKGDLTGYTIVMVTTNIKIMITACRPLIGTGIFIIATDM